MHRHVETESVSEAKHPGLWILCSKFEEILKIPEAEQFPLFTVLDLLDFSEILTFFCRETEREIN